MLAEAYPHIRKVYLAVGYTDLRKGIDGLAQIVGTKYNLNPYEKDLLFLFCGKRCDRIKGLLWEGTGFLLLYKRLEDGAFVWPRSTDEAAELTEQQYRYLMTGLDPFPRTIREVHPDKVY
jgi:transposase